VLLTVRPDSKVYVAGHTGLVGSAILRLLRALGHTNILTRTHAELDLERQADVESFFQDERPEYVFLAAAKVGGIMANATYPAEFIYRNLLIGTHVIHASWRAGVRRLLFMGSSCIYPRQCPQPMQEGHLLTAPLEPTNQPYAVAKIAGIVQCEAYNRQYGTRFLAVMPTNVYGPGDNFDLETGHVAAALIRKFHLAKLAMQGDWEGIRRDQRLFGPIPRDLLGALVSISRQSGHGSRVPLPEAGLDTEGIPPCVPLWGSGSARREFLHVDDLASACVFLMDLPEDRFESLLFPSREGGGGMDPALPSQGSMPIVNVGTGEDLTIREFASLVAEAVGYAGGFAFDGTRPDGTPRKLLDVSRIRRMGWVAEIPLRRGIELTYRWYLDRGQRGTP
jgi:GDP-L-fucose synthase